MNHSKNYFKILKTIDFCYNNQIKLQFDLEKLHIKEHSLGLYLHNLINKGFIEGVDFINSFDCQGYECFYFKHPVSLTFDGMMYLENNSDMKVFYSNLKELRDWFVAVKSF